jgi:hypothetical protein
MMDFSQLLQPGALPIDLVMIILVLLGGLFQKKYLSDININAAWKTLIVSFTFCAVYAILYSIAYKYQKELPLRWFFSYVTGTSLYELLLKNFLKKIFPQE